MRSQPDSQFANNRKKTVVLIVICALLVAVLGVLVFFSNQKKQAIIAENKKIAEEIEAEDKEKRDAEAASKATAEKRVEEILLRTPGIVCWGDGLTSGYGANGTNYPEVLEQIMKEDGYSLPVENMGVVAEDTNTILARAGAYEVVLEEDITIPAKTTPVKIKMTTKENIDINLVRTGNRGFYNVTINGVEGRITVKQPSPNNDNYKSDNYTHYFTRNKPGEEVKVAGGTQIINDASYEFKDYIPIIFIGQNGGWNDAPEMLISQQEKLIKTFDKNADKYLIVGIIAGDDESSIQLEDAMKDKWGNKYLNLREYLTDQEILEKAEVKLDDEDKKSLKAGEIPEALISSETRLDVELHLNSKGQELIADAVYQKLQELKYIEK